MFGLSFEKLLIAGVIAVIVLGPRRLPYYAQRLGELIRLLRTHLEGARVQAAETLGQENWPTFDPRQYDPRRIVREALSETVEAPASTRASAAAGRYVVTGSSGHPQKRLVAPATDDPEEAQS